jgi:trk system potassium uptake protein TrkH
VKVTTFGILLMMLVSRLKGQTEPMLFNRTLSKETTGKAMIIVLSSGLIIVFILLLLLLSEGWNVAPEAGRGDFVVLLFEAISAYGTVGLSMGVTPQLTSAGRFFIILLMFIGRLGPLTMAVALTRSAPRGKFRYARGELMVG